MVTQSLKALTSALEIVKEFLSKSGSYACPICGGGSLTEDELLRHTSLYHNQHPGEKPFFCPVCGEAVAPYTVHLFNKHGPYGRGEAVPEHQLTVRNTYTFALMVCRRKTDGKFLLVQEVANWGWWLPGGRVNRMEDLITAVTREAKEESGINVNVTGILRFEYSPSGLKDARMRVVFFGEPIDETQEPKTFPDFESMGATWVEFGQVAKLPLRSKEPLFWFDYVLQGKPIYPLSVLSSNG